MLSRDSISQTGQFFNRILPKYSRIPLLFTVVLNFSVYWGARAIAGGFIHHNIETSLDDMIPVVYPTVVIYFGCYIFWIINYILIYRRSREYAYRFFVADFLSRIVCLVFFLCYPTTLVRPAVEGEGIFYEAIRFLYKIDAPTNLFPSIHCLVSWFCFIGIISDIKIPKWYKVMSFLIALAVFVSTLTTRQHVIVDVVGGIVLAQICYLIAQKTNIWRCFEKTFDYLNGFFAE